MNQAQKFSEDAYENQRVENQLTKLQIEAEFGPMISPGPPNEEEIDPMLEKGFLEYIYKFEKAYETAKITTVFEKCGKPVFIPAEAIEPDLLKRELSRLMDLMASKDIILDVNDGPYPSIDIYRFITEELFQKEMQDLNVEGIRAHFIYEEFYPNHNADIARNTHEFIRCWIAREFTDFHPSMSKYILSPAGEKFNEAKFDEKLRKFFDAFIEFRLQELKITYVEFELCDDPFENLQGLGFAEGEVSYDAIMDNGETLNYCGRFKVFFSRKYDWWSINCFVMPGFVW